MEPEKQTARGFPGRCVLRAVAWPEIGAGESLGSGATMAKHEWIHLTAEQLSADPGLVKAVERFRAPAMPAGDAATAWLKSS